MPPPTLPRFVTRHDPHPRQRVTLAGGALAGRALGLLDRHPADAPADAPAVLLVHGNPTWSFLWRRVIAHLDGLRCVAPDLAGLGLSDTIGVGEHSLAAHADAVAEVVERLGLERLVLVGQDWGGPIAVGVGARHPRRVAGVVLANTAVLVPRRPRGALFHRLARLPVVSDLLFRGLGFPQNGLHRVQADRSSISGDVARAYRWPLRGWKRRAAPLALARMVPDSREHPTLPELARGEEWLRGFGGPAELVWGTRDPILGGALGKHREALPHARVSQTGRAGHFLQEEVPELLAAAVRRVAGRPGSLTSLHP